MAIEVVLCPDLIPTATTPLSVMGRGTGMIFMIARCPDIAFEGLRVSLANIGRMKANASGVGPGPEAAIRLDEVEGYKYELTEQASGTLVEVKYLLRVPGGSVSAILSAERGTDGEIALDPTHFEAALATISIVEN